MIRIINFSLIAAFVLQDIAWSDPDIFSSSNRPNLNTLAVPSFFSNSGSPSRVLGKFLKAYFETKPGVPIRSLTVDVINKLIEGLPANLRKNIAVTASRHEVTMAFGPGYILRYFDPRNESEDKYSNEKRTVQINDNLSRQLLIVKSLSLPNDADAVSGYITGLLADKSHVLATAEEYEYHILKPLFYLLFKRLDEDFISTQDFMAKAEKIIASEGCLALRQRMNSADGELATAFKKIRKGLGCPDGSIGAYGILLHYLTLNPAPYLDHIYGAVLPPSSADNISFTRPGVSYRTRGDSVVYIYDKGRIFEGHTARYHNIGARPYYDEKEPEIRTKSSNANKVLKALEILEKQAGVPDYEYLRGRAAMFREIGVVDEIDMKTNLLFSDSENNVVRIIHSGRTRPILYFSKTFIDSLDFNNEKDIRQLAVWLNLGMRLIENHEEMMRNGANVNQIQARTARFSEHFFDTEDSGLLAIAEIKNSLYELARKDAIIKYSVILPQVIKEEEESEVTLINAMSNRSREMASTAYKSFHHLLFHYEALGIHSRAEKAYSNMTQAVSCIQVNDTGLLPYTYQMILVFLALRFGRWDDFIFELTSLLTGKNYGRNMKRSELDVVRFLITKLSPGQETFEDDIRHAIASHLMAATAETRGIIANVQAQADKLLKDFFANPFGSLKPYEIDEDFSDNPFAADMARSYDAGHNELWIGDTTNPFILEHIRENRAIELYEKEEKIVRIRFDRSNPRAPPIEAHFKTAGIFSKIRQAKDRGLLKNILQRKSNFRNLSDEEQEAIIQIVSGTHLSLILDHVLIGKRLQNGKQPSNIITHTRTGFSKYRHHLEPTIWLGEIMLNRLSVEQLAQLLLEEAQHILKPPRKIGSKWINDHGKISDAQNPQEVIEHDQALINEIDISRASYKELVVCADANAVRQYKRFLQAHFPAEPAADGLTDDDRIGAYSAYLDRALGLFEDVKIWVNSNGKVYELSFSSWLAHLRTWLTILDIRADYRSLKDGNADRKKTIQELEKLIEALKTDGFMLMTMTSVKSLREAVMLPDAGSEDNPAPHASAGPYFVRKVFIESENAEQNIFLFRHATAKMDSVLNRMKTSLERISAEPKPFSPDMASTESNGSKDIYNKVIALNGTEIIDSKNECFVLHAIEKESYVYPLIIEIRRKADNDIIGSVQLNIKDALMDGRYVLDLGFANINIEEYQGRGIFPRILSLLSNLMPQNSELHISSLEETKTLKALAAGVKWSRTRMGRMLYRSGWKPETIAIFDRSTSATAVLLDRTNRWPEFFDPRNFTYILANAIRDIDVTDRIDDATVLVTLLKINRKKAGVLEKSMSPDMAKEGQGEGTSQVLSEWQRWVEDMRRFDEEREREYIDIIANENLPYTARRKAVKSLFDLYDVDKGNLAAIMLARDWLMRESIFEEKLGNLWAALTMAQQGLLRKKTDRAALIKADNQRLLKYISRKIREAEEKLVRLTDENGFNASVRRKPQDVLVLRNDAGSKYMVRLPIVNAADLDENGRYKAVKMLKRWLADSVLPEAEHVDSINFYIDSLRKNNKSVLLDLYFVLSEDGKEIESWVDLDFYLAPISVMEIAPWNRVGTAGERKYIGVGSETRAFGIKKLIERFGDAAYEKNNIIRIITLGHKDGELADEFDRRTVDQKQVELFLQKQEERRAEFVAIYGEKNKDDSYRLKYMLSAVHNRSRAGVNTDPLPERSKIILSSSLFDDSDRGNLERLFKGSNIEIADLADIKHRATNNKATKDNMAIVLTKEEFEAAWDRPDDKYWIKSSVLLLDDKLTGPNYLYLEGVIGLARAIMARDKQSIALLYNMLSRDKLGAEALDAIGDNAVAFAIKAILKFKPVKVDPKQIENYKITMEKLLMSA